MNRLEPTTLWSVAAYRLWVTTSLGLACSAANYAAMGNYFVSNAFRKQSNKGIGDKLSSMSASRSSSPVSDSARRSVSSPPSASVGDLVKKVVAPDVSVANPPSKQVPAPSVANEAREPLANGPSVPSNAAAAKPFVPPPGSHGKGGKKRRHRPEGKDHH
ncbi:MAG: hypothetical protein HY308_05005 [Gammaproteobacteria bacterium]|nr:hypothetical protein [Gammaproteobacteria bacterium]